MTAADLAFMKGKASVQLRDTQEMAQQSAAENLYIVPSEQHDAFVAESLSMLAQDGKSSDGPKDFLNEN